MVLWHGASVTSMSSMAFHGNHRRSSRDIVSESTTSMNWNALELHQSLSDLGVGARIDLAALCITKEIIQSLETTFSVIIGGMLTEISSMTDGIVDRAVRRRLLRGIVAVVCLVVGSAVLRSRARVHLRGMIIVTIGGSCKILQVSNHCNPSSDVGMCREQPVLLFLHTFSALSIAILTSVLFW